MNHRELITALTPLHSAGEARAIVRLVMEERFGLSQTDLLLGKDTELSRTDRAEFEKIAQRLLAGEPVQHVLGYATFCGRRFRVTPDVLIPRPETEELVHWAIEQAPVLPTFPSQHSPFQHSPFQHTPSQHSPSGGLGASHSPSGGLGASPLRVLDLCTGSGCIAVSLALALPAARVVGVDISAPALAIARENASALGAPNVSFVQQDILQDNASSQHSPLGGLGASPSQHSPLGGLGASPSSHSPLGGLGASLGASAIVSNPPYVRNSEAADIHPTVLDHEPSLALFVPDEDPLRFYHAIARIGLRTLIPGGCVLVEINAALAEDTRALFASYGYAGVTLRNDQFGRPRMLRAIRPTAFSDVK